MNTVLYSYRRDHARSRGAAWVNPEKIRREKIAQAAGVALMAFSLGVLSFLFTPVALVELRYQLQQREPVVVADSADTEAAAVRDEAAAHGLSSYFSVFIPKIDAKANIVPNVSTQNKNEYMAALTKGVAHARGTYFPGQGKNIFLFAHSTDSPANYARYNAVFYLLNRMKPGDEIVVYFLDKKYIYVVQQSVVTNADDTSWIYRDFGSETLVLQTCDPPGTTWRRLLVIAKPKI